MLRQWRYLHLSLLLVIFGLLAACAAEAPPAQEAVPDPGAAAVEQPAAPEGLASIPRERTLIMAGLGGEHPGAFTDVELFNHFSPGLSRSGYYQACTEGLFYYNMIGDDFIPWMAEGYEFNDDFTEVIVTLRDGVTWSDGEPFDTSDIAFTVELMLEDSSLNRAGQIIDTVESVEIIDELTIQFNLTRTNPRFVFDVLTFRADLGVPIVPQHVFEGQDAGTYGNYDPDAGLPLCTGPYELVATTVEQKIWDRRDDWWAAQTGFHELPEVERLIYLPGMNEQTMVQMIINNEIDIAFSVTAANYELVQAQNPAVITHSDEPPYGFLDWWPISLGFNHDIEPFDDPEIRWAISYALDRDEIIQFAFRNTTTAIQLPYPDYPGLQPYFEHVGDLLAEYDTTEFNLDKTNEIMTGKGYTKDNEDMWVDENGERIRFEIITFPQHPSTTPQAPIVAEQLRRAGFDASFLLPADFVDRVYTGEAVAFLWGHGGSMNDPYTTLNNLYHMRHYRPTGETTNGANIWRWQNAEFSAVVDEMTAVSADDPALFDLFHAAMEIWLPELPDIMLVETVILVPMNTTYWNNWPNPDNPYIHEGFWHRTSLHLILNLEPVQ